MDPVAATSSASSWRRSVRCRAPEAEEERELGRRVDEMETTVERLRAEKEEAEAEEGELRAELEAERAAAETAASEAMLMIERLQRDKAAALVEARQFRRLAEGRADRDRVMQDELASVSALAASYLSLLRAHGVDPEDDDDDGNNQKEQPPVEHPDAEEEEESRGSCGDSDFKDKVVVARASPSLPPQEKVFDHTAHVKRAAATAAGNRAADMSENLHGRVEALEADWTAMRREVAALRAERAQAVLAREVARRLLCRETAPQKPRFSVLAICKVVAEYFSQIWR
ncbi:myosin-binding protein 7-like [Oryza brachyantha]|uniref:myosin-binding protein 7-like n=1 Tax=Oryza brachyantha TaxID=4533 RepID=UPI001ADD5C4E|nr:myosin-binding protein 7-like [Oryza brachyantha]